MRTLLLACTILCTTACTSETAHGPCIGAFDEKDPHKLYHTNAWNLAMGIIFVELIVPPIVVVVDETQCPYGEKP